MKKTHSNIKNHELRCDDVVVSIAGKGTTVKQVCLSEQKRRDMEEIINTRKAVFDALADY